MVETIGQQLLQARKLAGLSLREAAEQTKIRGDFLMHLENDELDFNLPEIYKRGFLKIYARFLKLNVEEIIGHYERVHKPSKDDASHAALALLSRIETTRQQHLEIEKEEEEAQVTKEYAAHSHVEGDPAALRMQRIIWIRRGVVAGGAALAVWAIVALVGSWQSNAPTEALNPQLTALAQSMAKVEQKAIEHIELVALADVHVVVRQENDRLKLFSGTLLKGQRIALDKSGPIKIRFSEGESLLVEKNGQQYGMNARGTGVRLFE